MENRAFMVAGCAESEGLRELNAKQPRTEEQAATQQPCSLLLERKWERGRGPDWRLVRLRANGWQSRRYFVEFHRVLRAGDGQVRAGLVLFEGRAGGPIKWNGADRGYLFDRAGSSVPTRRSRF